MVLVRNNYRDLGGAWVIGDRVVRYTNKLVSIECSKSALPIFRLDQPANELVELNRIQSEEAVVAIMIGEVSMKRHDGVGIVGTQATQRYNCLLYTSGGR